MDELATLQDQLRNSRSGDWGKLTRRAADRLDAQEARIAELTSRNSLLERRLESKRGQLSARDKRIAELEEALKPFAELGLNDDKTIIRGIVDALLAEGKTCGSQGMASIQWLMEKCLAARKALGDS